MAGGYDIGASIASTSGASITSPINITGGGGSNATVSDTAGQSALNAKQLALAFLLCASVLIGAWLFLGRKR